MIAEFIDPQDRRWRDFLETVPHDFYHLPEYLEFAAKYEGGRATAFLAEDRGRTFFAPLLIQSLPEAFEAVSGYDAITPYGYPTPLMSEANDEALEHFLDVFRNVAQTEHIVTVFMRFHPLIEIPLDPFARHGRLAKHGQTVYADLSCSLDKIWETTSKSHRRDIRRLVDTGYQVKVDDWSLYDEFIAIYHETMSRLSATDRYLFSVDYFYDLRRTLNDSLHLFVVLSPSEQVICGGLFTATDGIIQYHLSGTSGEYRKEAPTKLMLHQARCWAKENNQRLFHLGGGVGAKDNPLFSFKYRFTYLTADYHTCSMVIDPEKYEALVELWQQACETTDDFDFFPLYRRLCPDQIER